MVWMCLLRQPIVPCTTFAGCLHGNSRLFNMGGTSWFFNDSVSICGYHLTCSVPLKELLLWSDIWFVDMLWRMWWGNIVTCLGLVLILFVSHGVQLHAVERLIIFVSWLREQRHLFKYWFGCGYLFFVLMNKIHIDFTVVFPFLQGWGFEINKKKVLKGYNFNCNSLHTNIYILG